ncbi:MAG: hypothetical protein AAF702_35710 [Chloroflexota bacterium]
MSFFKEQPKPILLILIALFALAVCFDFLALTDVSFVLAQGDTQAPTPTHTPVPTVTSTFTPAPPTATPTITLTPTPTATPGNIAQIVQPKMGEAIAGSVVISGTALIDEYRKFELHVSEMSKENWQWVTTSYKVVRGDELYIWDTSQYNDGFYDLRLRAISDGGPYNETFLQQIEIRNANPPTPSPTPTPTIALNEAGTPISPLETPTSTPLPTPIVDTSIRIPGGQGLYAPEENATLIGYVPIDATVNNLGFQFFERYELYISVTGLESWRHLVTSGEQHWQDTIYVLNTNLFANGTYDLRLRVVYQDSNYSEYHLRHLHIANPEFANPESNNKHVYQASTNGIHQPRSGESVSGVVDFLGTAVDTNFLRWELYWSFNGKENWSFLVSDKDPVVGALLARLDLSQLPVGYYDFRLRVVQTDHNYQEYFARRVHLAAMNQ